MNATLCAIRKATIVQVSRPTPPALWRFHWHELFPIARGANGNGSEAFYLPEVESGTGRRALRSRLRETLGDLAPEHGSRTVVDGCMVEVMEDRAGLLPDFVEAEFHDLIEDHRLNGSR